MSIRGNTESPSSNTTVSMQRTRAAGGVHRLVELWPGTLLLLPRLEFSHEAPIQFRGWARYLQGDPRSLKNAHLRPFSVVAALLLAVTFSFTAVPARAATITLGPTADAVVKSATPSTNYGPAAGLKADDSPAEMSSLKFVVTGTGGTVTAAKLRLFVADPSPSGGQFQNVPDTNSQFRGGAVCHSRDGSHGRLQPLLDAAGHGGNARHHELPPERRNGAEPAAAAEFLAAVQVHGPAAAGIHGRAPELRG